jgi:hypothetical protein
MKDYSYLEQLETLISDEEIAFTANMKILKMIFLGVKEAYEAYLLM